MKLCIVWDSILSLEKSSKGDIAQIVEIASALAGKVDVTLVALNAGKMKIPGVKIFQVPNLWYIIQRTRILGRIIPALYGYDSTFNARHIAKYVSSVLEPKEKFDVYYVRTKHLAIELRRLQPHKKIVYVAIPSYYHTRSEKDKIFNQQAIDSADILLSLTEGWRKYTLETFDTKGKDIHVIPVCINREKLQNAPELENEIFKNKKTIGYFGRLQENYGIDTLIEAVPELKKTFNNFSVVIAGGSVYGHDEKLKILANRLGVQNEVHFLREIPRHLVPAYIKKCDVMVSLRYDEIAHRGGFDLSIPIKCIEYIAQGKPLVATRDGGMEQLLGKDYPYFVEPGNKTQIVQMLTYLLENPETAKSIGLKNQEISVKYSSETVSDNLLQHIMKYSG